MTCALLDRLRQRPVANPFVDGRPPQPLERLTGFVSIVVAVAVLLAPTAEGSTAADQARLDRALRSLCARSEDLLGKLEYESARAMLEAAVEDAAQRRASSAVRAEFFARLGWARAELGDTVGAEEAFRKAVRLDREITLPKRTSPKILAALDRVRAAMAQAALESPPRSEASSSSPSSSSPSSSSPSSSSPSSSSPSSSSAGPRSAEPPSFGESTSTPSAPRLGPKEAGTAPSPSSTTGARPSMQGSGPISGEPAQERTDRKPPTEEAWSRDSRATRPGVAQGLPAMEGKRPPSFEVRPSSAPADHEFELGPEGVVLVSIGAIAVLAGITIAAVLVSGSSERCRAKEGLGCLEVEILPLLSF